jgi:hypothetical protein
VEQEYDRDFDGEAGIPDHELIPQWSTYQTIVAILRASASQSATAAPKPDPRAANAHGQAGDVEMFPGFPEAERG